MANIHINIIIITIFAYLININMNSKPIPKKAVIHVDTLINVIQEVFEIADITTKSREKEYIIARAVFAKICLKSEILSLSDIARALKLKSHATVINMLKKFDLYAFKYPEFTDKYEFIKDMFDVVYDEKPEIIYTKKATDLRQEIVRLKAELYNAKYKPEVDGFAKDIAMISKDLTESQIDTLKVRIESFVSICKDQNKRNGYFTDKGL